MFHAQKLMAKAAVATTRFFVCPRRSTTGAAGPLVWVTVLSSLWPEGQRRLRSRSRVPTGLQPLRDGREPVSARSRLR